MDNLQQQTAYTSNSHEGLHPAVQTMQIAGGAVHCPLCSSGDMHSRHEALSAKLLMDNLQQKT